MNPISLYARSKIESEKGIKSLIDENFSPTIMRMGTLYGWSPRMRFDLVVNLFGMLAPTEKKIGIFGGDQWRPMLNVEDAAEAFVKVVEAPIQDVRGEVFNVGSDEQNYQIKEFGEMVKEVYPETDVVFTEQKTTDGQQDDRDYRVNFDKSRKVLDFRPHGSIKKSLKDIGGAIERGEITDVKNPIYYNDKI